MANEEHLEILLWQGSEVWNEWRAKHPDVRPDLIGADLTEAFLTEANLSGADLTRANLTKAGLTRANLTEANLNAANFSLARLNAADMSRSQISSTIFGDNDLSEVKGLDTVQHRGPSTIGVDTIYRSGGKIPEAFLRGCGVPYRLIKQIPSLIDAMQFYSCFISHSSKDKNFVQQFCEQMQNHHLSVYYAPEHLKAGRTVEDQIDLAIRVHDKLVLVLSRYSLHNKSVQTEIRRARQTELENNRRKLFPIRLVKTEALADWECIDPETGEDNAAVIRKYHIPDFTRWKERDAFEREFARLLRDLKAVDEPPVQPLTPPAPTAPSRASGLPARQRETPTPQNRQTIIEIKRRRLRLLEEQQALKGVNTSPEVVIEIEDLLREIAAWEGG
jgi:TIR domain/Pentapeptide repeats (8 copies)